MSIKCEKIFLPVPPKLKNFPNHVWYKELPRLARRRRSGFVSDVRCRRQLCQVVSHVGKGCSGKCTRDNAEIIYSHCHTAISHASCWILNKKQESFMWASGWRNEKGFLFGGIHWNGQDWERNGKSKTKIKSAPLA